MANKNYVATENIFFGTALGYAPGDPVAEDVVVEHGLQDSVVGEKTKAAAEAAKPAEGLSTP